MKLLCTLVILGFGCSETPSEDETFDAGASDAPNVEIDAAVPLRCTGLSAQPVDSDWTIRSGDLDRVAAVHVPELYDPTLPAAVVLNFHGFTQSGGQQALLTRMNDKSDDEGFIAVHATGVGVVNGWNGGDCCGEAADNNVDDVGFVDDLITELSLRLCIDPARIYATGFSNGGFLSHRLACELPSRIAAIAPVSGVLGIEACEPNRTIPVMEFHGTADTVVPYNGSLALGFVSVDETIAHWQAHNGCSGESVTFDEGMVSCSSATGCDEGGAVTLCTVAGGGHTWPGGIPIPGGGLTTNDIIATDAMWDFFIANPHPSP